MGFVVAGGDPAPVLQLVEQPLDQVSQAVFLPVVRNGIAAVALCGDHRLDAGSRDLITDGIGVIAAISEERLDPALDHPEQWGKTLHVMRLSRRQDEAEREALGFASGMELGGEASSRSAEALCLLSPLFKPTAQ